MVDPYCLINRWRDAYTETVFDRTGPHSSDCCEDFTYIIVIIDFLVGMLPCPDECDDETISVERYTIHQWRKTVDDNQCLPPNADYLMFHELRTKSSWRLVHVESGVLASPDFGTYLPFADAYCHTENNDFGVTMLELVHARLLSKDSEALAEIFTPIANGSLEWNGTRFQCPDGSIPNTSAPCCDDDGGGDDDGPPPLAENLPPGVSIVNVEPPPGATTYPGIGYHDPLNRVSCLLLDRWELLSFADAPLFGCTAGNRNGISQCVLGFDTDVWFTDSFPIPTKFCGRSLWQSSIRYVKPICDQYGFASSYQIQTVGGDVSGVTLYSVDKPHEFQVRRCGTSAPCTRWLMEVRMETNGLFPFPAGLVIRNHIEVICGSKPSIRYDDMIPYVYCGTTQLGPIGFAASTYRWFRFSGGPIKCLG